MSRGTDNLAGIAWLPVSCHVRCLTGHRGNTLRRRHFSWSAFVAMSTFWGERIQAQRAALLIFLKWKPEVVPVKPVYGNRFKWWLRSFNVSPAEGICRPLCDDELWWPDKQGIHCLLKGCFQNTSPLRSMAFELPKIRIRHRHSRHLLEI